MKRKRHSTVGLGTNGRIDWEGNWVNKAIAVLAARRYHGKFIAEITGLSVSQVYSRCRAYGIVLRQSRDGDCEEGRADLLKFHHTNIKPATQRMILKSVATPE